MATKNNSVEVEKITDNSAVNDLFEGLIVKMTPEDIKTLLEKHNTLQEVAPRLKAPYNKIAVKQLGASVEKHVNSLLTAIHKLQDVSGITEAALNEQYKDTYKDNASAFAYTPRVGKGGRKAKDAVAA